MLIRHYIFAITAVISSHTWAAETCTAIDLRNPNVAPVRNQTEDSEWCFAFGLANAAGQALGKAVSPEYIALTVNATISPYGPKSIDLFRKGGSSGEAHVAVESAGGYCSAKGIAPYLQGKNWYEALKKRASGISNSSFLANINKSCDRDRLSKKFNFNYDAGKFGSFVLGSDATVAEREQNAKDNQARHQAERNRLFKKIKPILEMGRFAVVGIKSGPGDKALNHIFTVVGQTADCHLIVQDSIPESYYNKFGKPKYFDFVQNGHFQYWRPQVLNDHIDAVGYAEPSSQPPPDRLAEVAFPTEAAK